MYWERGQNLFFYLKGKKIVLRPSPNFSFFATPLIDAAKLLRGRNFLFFYQIIFDM